MQEENKNEGYSLTWETLKPDWPLWVIIAGLFTGAIVVHLRLPEEMPLSWALFEPVMILGLYLLMLLVPLIDPWRKNYARFGGVYRLLRLVTVIFMAGTFTISKAEAVGYNIDTELIVNGSIALLFIITGNVMGQIRPNFFVGIRVPWTLANEEVWRRTHRLAAKLWVAGGLICLSLAPVRAPWGTHSFVLCMLVIVLVPIAYSYIIYRKVVHEKKTPEHAKAREND
ncbi:MAG: SdpI family protein [Bacillota bacterium]